MESLIRAIYSFSFSLFGITINSDDLSGTIWSLLDIGHLLNGNSFTLYRYVQTINDAVVSIGISLLTLFFMINLIKLLTQEGVERISWERIVLRACVFFLLNVFITHSMEWFGQIAEIVQNSVLEPVAEAMDMGLMDGTHTSESLGIADALVAIAESAGSIEKYLYYIIFVILAIPFMATIIMILSQVFLRAVKLLIYIMFAPIPIAFAAEGDAYRGKAISFFLQFAGVCFEAVIIYIGTFIYNTGLQSLVGDNLSAGDAIPTIIGILFMNGLFAAIIQLSSTLSSQFFGRG